MTANQIKSTNTSLAGNASGSSIHKRGLGALSAQDKHLTEAEKLYAQGVAFSDKKEFQSAFRFFSAAADLEHAPAYFKLAECYEDGLGVTQSDEQWLSSLKKACDLNHPEAIWSYGFYLLHGYTLIEKDELTGFTYLQKSAELGYPRAMSDLANCYLKGMGTPAYETLAISWYERAINSGYHQAKKQLSDYYFRRDKNQAFLLFKEYVDDHEKFLINAGKEVFMFNDWLQLAICYIYSIGTEQDMGKAKSLIQQCSIGYESFLGIQRGYILFFVKLNQIPLIDLFEKIEQLGFENAKKLCALTYLFGYFKKDDYDIEEIIAFRKRGLQLVAHNKALFSQNNYECLNSLYLRRYENEEIKKQFLILGADLGIAGAQFELAGCYFNGEIFEQDFNKAFIWYEKAAEQDNAEAQNKLGTCYYHGQGTKQDYSKAVYWYEKSAEQGHDEAQNSLGDCYYHGQGTTQDYLKAVYWYEKAAEQELDDAFYNLGHCYEHGLGVDNNPVLAVQNYREAAERGHVYAKYELGLCYANGYGVDEDMLQCAFWMRKSAEQGYDSAIEYLEELKDMLS